MWGGKRGAGRALLAGLAFVLLAAGGARGQGEAAPPSGYALEPRKIDEFGRVGGCDHSARLDNLAIELQENPAAVGYVIAYGPEGQGSGTGNFRLRVTRSYLTYQRGISEERVVTVYGGPYHKLDESASELWLVPPGALPPQPTRYTNDAADFTGKFSESGVWGGLTGEFYDAGTGPPVGDVRMAAFAEMLRLRPDARGYIVLFHGEDSAPGAWRRVGAREAQDLRKSYGVEPDRVSVVFGGYDKEARMQLWILPKDDPPPVAGVPEERKPEAAAQVGSFEQFMLSDEESRLWVYKGLGDLLRGDEHLRGWIIVRLPYGGVSEEAGGEAEETGETEAADEVGAAGESGAEAEAAPEELPEVDLLQLVEKWKKDFGREYGIGEHRLTVVVVPPRDESSGGELETWVVPPGAAPPDAYAVKEENAGTDGEGAEADGGDVPGAVP